MYQRQLSNTDQQQSHHFSTRIFSHLSKLITLSHQPQSSETLKQIKQLQQQFHSPSYTKYDSCLLSFVTALAVQAHIDNKQPQNQQSNSTSALKQFLNIFSQTKSKIPQIDNIVNNHQHTQLIVCDQKRVCSLKEELQKYKQKNRLSKNHHKKSSSHHHHSIGGDFTKSAKTNNNNNSNQQQSYKAYVIYGKAINVEKHKKSTQSTIIQSQQGQGQNPIISSTIAIKTLASEDIAARQQIIENLEYCMSLMHEQQKLIYSKCEPNQLQDLLLTHQLSDASLLPIIVTNQVYKYFVPLDCVILLIIPQHIIDTQKQQAPLIFKDTLLHIYLDNFKILTSKCMYKQTLFKNSTFKGVYFVEEGEVETKSGRIVARGWVINGKCKSTTHVWRFHKVMAFFKYILNNQNIWKQFVNDIKLNNQHPIKVANILNIDDKVYQQIMGHQSTNFKPGPNNQRGKRLKFPPISGRLNKSFDLAKLNEIERMKHFDEKIQFLHEVKQEVLKKKIDYGAKKLGVGKEGHSMSQAQAKEMNMRIHILSQKMNLPMQQRPIKTDASKSLFLPPGQSSANILITGIVKKLKSIHDTTSDKNSLQQSPRQQNKKKIMYLNRSRTKILGLKRYEQIVKHQKNHLYKGKNFYN